MKNIKNLKKNKKGFTLVEIIVVLVIIGILMALAVPAVMKYVSQAADTKVESQVRAGWMAAQTVVTNEVGQNPGKSDDDLKKLVTSTDGVTNVNKELGLATNADGSIKKVECEVSNKKVDSCEIQVKDSEDTWTATQTKIVKKQANAGQ